MRIVPTGGRFAEFSFMFHKSRIKLARRDRFVTCPLCQTEYRREDRCESEERTLIAGRRKLRVMRTCNRERRSADESTPRLLRGSFTHPGLLAPVSRARG